jgi:hypothetical protein
MYLRRHSLWGPVDLGLYILIGRVDVLFSDPQVVKISCPGSPSCLVSSRIARWQFVEEPWRSSRDAISHLVSLDLLHRSSPRACKHHRGQHSLELNITSLPACRETLRAEKSDRYFDSKHPKLHTSLSFVIKIRSVVLYIYFLVI